MAELLASGGWVKAGSAGSYLRENLPDRYIVVADARPCGQRLAAAVVGHAALFVIQDADAAEPDAGEVAVAAPVWGGAVAVEAAQQFLKDEFPSLELPVVGLYGARDWAEGPVTWRVVAPQEWADLALADAIIAADSGGDAFTGDEMREDLALGLRDRQLTSSQTTQRPFVFPSGGSFRTGARVQSVRQAVAHMDRYPRDGVRVLRDGTLATWLEEEGALHLAALARDVMRQPKPNTRVALETFMRGAGLVDAPRLTVTPAQLDLGYILQGQKASRLLKLERARDSRGFIFGSLSGGSPWLKTEPREFEGTPVEVVVTAETGNLQIARDRYDSDIVISSNASASPVRLPVTLSVVAEPPRLIRFGVRPVVGLLFGGLIGAVLGILWRAAGLVDAPHAALWVVTLALVWGWAGALRAYRQPPAWPSRYALARWLAKVAAWSLGLGFLAAVIVEAWELGLGGGLRFDGLSLAGALAVGAAFGFAPATLDEMAHSRHAVDQDYVQGRHSNRRSILLAAGCVALLLIAVLTPRLIAATMNRSEVQAAVQPAQAWAEKRLGELERSLGQLIDDVTLRYYNKQPGVVGGPTAEPRIRLPGR